MNDSILIVGACFVYLAAACFAIIALGIVFASRWANGTGGETSQSQGHEVGERSERTLDGSE